MRWLPCAGLLLCLPGAVLAQGTGFCRDSVAPPGAPARDLYCIDLSASPAVRGARAVLELGIAKGPFGIAAAPDGRMRHRLLLSIEGLPAPGTLGAYTTWVAWVADPALDPIIRLGAVSNGSNDLGEVALDRFLVLVTAEPWDTVPTFSGPAVLQGLSASTRMGAHGIVIAPAPTPGTDEHAGHDAPGGWRHPAMRHPLPMPPVPHDLRPGTAPWLPDSAGAPMSRPRELLELADGDSLVLEAGPVRKRLGQRVVTLYGFNGQVPGPVLAVRQATTVVITFVNHTHLPTAIHWHGLRQDNRMDGVPGLTQPPVPPGGTFRYEVHFPDAGLYWYHPHHREDLLQDAGLAGNLLVRPEDPAWLGPVHRDEVVMLDDLLLDDAGLLPWGRDAATHALMGRFGNLLLVNGEPRWEREARPGEVVRLWLTNVSNTRTWNLSLPGARLKVVASDLGRFEREEWVENVVIAPAERYVVDARFGEPGTVPLLNRIQVLDHVGGRILGTEDTLGTITVAGPPASPDLAAAFAELRRPAGAVEDAAALRAALARPPERELTLTLETDSLPFVLQRMFRLDTSYVHPVEWEGTMPLMDLIPTTEEVHWILRDPATGRENDDIEWHQHVGDRVRLRLRNDRSVLHPMAHPIHVHGQRFVVLARNGVPVDNLAWKDTALVPVGGTVDLLVEFTNPGKWMIHCHVAEHLSAGMAMVVVVE